VWGLGYRDTRDRFQSGTGYSIFPDRRNDRLLSAFIQDEFTLLPARLSLTVGAKLEHISFDYPDETPSYRKLTLQPNVRFLLKLAEENVVWGAVSRAVRNPSRADHDVIVNSSVIPPSSEVNPTPLPILVGHFGQRSFQPETLTAYELGYRSQINARLSLDLAAYYNRYDELRGGESLEPSFERVPVPHFVFPVGIANDYGGTAYGGEISGRWNPFLPWSAVISYAYFRGNFNSKTEGLGSLVGSAAEPFKWIALGQGPRHQVFGGMSWDLPRNLQLDMDLRWVGELTNVASYGEMDLRFGWYFGESAELAIVGQNLLHDTHQEFGQEVFEVPTLAQRAVYGKLTWEF
jgi:iron complex outermembrane receptor protein